MLVFPNCKINLGLTIIGKRDDGFHNLETVFYPLPFFDVFEIIATPATKDISFAASGIPVQGDVSSNLCVKAWYLLKKDFPGLPAVQMHLHKAIPMGAGLGGGSADGAFALKLFNDHFNLGLSGDQLIHYAQQLGSDCPFFIINKPCFATGRGEKLEPIAIDLDAYKFVIINPGIHISTAGAFSQIKPAKPAKSIQQIIRQPVNTWRDELKNDFEEGVFASYPEIAGIKDRLYEAGAIYASMSGTGSTIYGIFEKRISPLLSFPPDYFIKHLSQNDPKFER